MKMNKIKEQLREFYTKNNIGMKRREKLIKSDITSIKRQLRMFYDFPVNYNEIDLLSMFIWQESIEGHYYWSARCIGVAIEDIYKR